MTEPYGESPQQPLPASFGPHYGAIVWIGMVLMAALGCIPLWVGWYQLTRGMVDLSEESLDSFILMTGMGLFLLAFPALFVWSLIRGLPRLDIGEGWLRHVSILGRVSVLDLDHYAEAVLGESVLAKGYQPRLELYPALPGDKTQIIPLRPHVTGRSEAEAIIALVHCAAGPRPSLSTEQMQQSIRTTRRDYKIMAGIVIISILMLIALNLIEPQTKRAL
ncbi:MAG: hypothetical protein ACU0B7_02895 [Paracoccaceae bacterium]